VIEGNIVVHEIDLAATPEVVFAMFVDPERLVRWIGVTADVEPRPGGIFRFEVVSGQFCEGRYLTVEPPDHLVFTWGWTDPAMGLPPGSSSVEVTLHPEGPGTRLRLVHSGLSTAAARLLHEDGWNRFLERLSATVEDHDVPPYPSESPQDRLQVLQNLKGEQWR